MTVLDPPALVPLTEITTASDDGPGDSGYGWVMFVGFTLAVVAISLAVGVLALAGSWWMLGVAVAAHLCVTTAMMKVVLGAFGSESEAYPDMKRTESASRAALAGIRPAPAPPVPAPPVPAPPAPAAAPSPMA